MKKALTILFVLALALAFTAPAMALKLETKGYMDVAGILVKNNVVDQNANTQSQSTAAWYQQEMIIEPVLHVNEWVRIHNKITIMERYWRGGHGAENDFINDTGGTDPSISILTRGANYRGEHNFWWEQMYLSFPLAGGHLYVGRRPGGAWGFPFQDSSSNRDRIQWVGKVLGKYTVAGVIEKLAESDARLATATTMTGPYLGRPIPNYTYTVNHAPYQESASDLDAYALGFVIPLTKEFSWQPLFYFIKDQRHNSTNENFKYLFLWDNAFKYKAGPFKIDAEINWWKQEYDKSEPDYYTTTRKRLAGWIDASYVVGPYEIGVGGFYLQGSTKDKNRQIASVGEDFEPYFILFSEDVGLLWNTGGVPNGTGGSSGYLSAYLRGGYKITDAMLLTAKLGFLRADKMNEAAYWAGGPKITPSKKLGTEFDLGYEFKFMKNIKYVVDAGVFFPGKYWDHTDGDLTRDLTNNVYGVRHMLVIEW